MRGKLLVKTDDITTYQEKRCGRADVGARMLTFKDIQRVVAFITTFAEEYAIVLPVSNSGIQATRYKISAIARDQVFCLTRIQESN